MNEGEIVYWVIFTVSPLFVGVGSLWMNFNKNKREQENRITRIESNVKDLKEDVKELKNDREFLRGEAKKLAEVNGKLEIVLSNIDELKKTSDI